MRVYNRYLMTLALVFTAVNVIMSTLDESTLDLHFTVLVVASLLVTLLFAFLNPRARRALSAISAAFLGGFLVVVALRVVDILKGV